MLNFNSAYAAQASTQNVVVDWLLELSYDDTTPGTFYLAGNDLTLTNRYHGIVEDWGDISESIDLASSQNSIGDIEISVINKWSNDSGLLSAELFGGSKKFFNQNVVIKSYIPGCTLAQCPTIFKGRLVDIQHSQEIVKLSVERRSPWDRVKIGTNVSTNNRIRFPEAYGAYERNVSTVASKDFVPNKLLWPMPVNDIVGSNVMCLLHNQASPQYENAHFYESSLDIFVPVDPVNVTEDDDYQGGYAIACPSTLKRGFDYRPVRVVDATSEFTNPANAIDGSTSTYAIKTFSGTGTTVDAFDLFVDIPAISGALTSISIAVKYSITLDAGSGADAEVSIWDASYGGSLPELEIINTNTTPGSTVSGAETIHSVSGYTTSDWFNSDRYSASNTLPEFINLRAVFADIVPDEAVIGSCKIYDIIIRISSELDFSTEEAAGYDKLSKVKQLYTGVDGFLQGFADGSGTASFPHDIYRDMLFRYTGWDGAELDSVDVNDSSWSESSIDTDRAWPCRWWTLEQLPVVDVLKQLQFEGAFIWIFDESTSGVEARVIYVKSAYSSADFILDYKTIDNLQVSTTPFSEIVTKRIMNYQRHPADNSRYLAQAVSTNLNRANYNLEAEENVIENNLDFMTDETDVYELFDYYDNIVGEPKIIVQCDILKPSDRALQVGDIVKFANMKYEPYGKSWATPIYFMCTKTIQNPDKFTATFREVG
jgi:hypothetical protein